MLLYLAYVMRYAPIILVVALITVSLWTGGSVAAEGSGGP